MARGAPAKLAGGHPGALLVRAELLTRHGGARTGRDASRVGSHKPAPRAQTRLCEPTHIAGQALYLRSRSDLAAPLYAKALEAARTDLDRKNALWGAFLAQMDLDIESSTGLLAELESAAPHDLNTRPPSDRRSADGRARAGIADRRLASGACARTARSTCPRIPSSEATFWPRVPTSHPRDPTMKPLSN